MGTPLTKFDFLNGFADSTNSFFLLVNSRNEIIYFNDVCKPFMDRSYKGRQSAKLFPKLLNDKKLFFVKKCSLNNSGIVLKHDEYALEWFFIPYDNHLEQEERKVLIIGTSCAEDPERKRYAEKIDVLSKKIEFIRKTEKHSTYFLEFLSGLKNYDFDNLLENIKKYLPKIFGMKYISIAYLQNDKRLRVIESNFEIENIVIENSAEKENVLFAAIDRKHPLLIENISQEDYDVVDTIRHQTKKCIIIPLLNNLSNIHKEIGVISLSDKMHSQRFSEKDTFMAEVLSSEIGNKIYQEKFIKAESSKLPVRDSLTGLYNHRIFHQTLTSFERSFRETKNPFSLVFLDIDKFEEINGNLGYETGDMILFEIAQLIKDYIDKEDFAAYYGNGKFGLIVRNNAVDALKTANTIKEAVSEQIKAILKLEQPIYVSGGICEARDFINSRGMVFNTDYALSNAKQTGRNKAVIFTPPDS